MPNQIDESGLLSLIADHIPVCIGYVDREETYRYANANYRTWLGLTAKEIVGRPATEVLGADIYRQSERNIRAALAGKASQLERTFSYPGVGARRVRVSYVPHWDRGGVEGYFLLVQDINDAYGAKAALRRSEHSMRLIADNMPAMIAYIDEHQIYRFANQITSEWFHRPIEEIVGSSVREVFGPQKYREIEPRLQGALDGKRADYEDRLTLADGRTRTMQVTHLPHRDEDDSVSGVFVFRQDVTELRETIDALSAREQQLQLLADTIPALICYVDETEKYRFANRAFSEWFGHRAEDIVGHPVCQLVGPTNYALIKGPLQRALNGETISFEDELDFPGRGRRATTVSYVPDKNDGRVRGVYVLRLDITRLKESEVERQIALDRLDLAVSATADGVWEWDLEADTVWHSPRSRTMLGLAEPAPNSAADQDTIESFLALVHTEDRERVEGALRAQIENQTPFDVEYRIDGVGKKHFWFHSHGQAVRDANGRPIRVVGINSDITERKQTEVALARYAAELARANRELADMRSELENQALYDPLTKLPNRRLFMDRLERAVTLLERTDLPYCVLLIDLDRFKAINDQYGHEAGDVVLRTVAERLIDGSRQADTVARLGGDEFVALTQAGPTVAGSTVLAERWGAAVRVPIPFDGGSLTVGCSIGVAHVSEAGINGVQALRLADQAMYQAKAAGGGFAISGESKIDDNAQQTGSDEKKSERPTSRLSNTA